MNDWQQEWWKQIEKTAADMEEFLTEVGKATESVVSELGDNVSSFIEHFQSDVAIDLDDLVREVVEVLIVTSDEIDAALSEEWEYFLDDDFTSVSYHTPSAKSHPACINCANYHGQSYNGNLLVCAMHPHGYEDRECPDWEADK